MHTHRIRTTEDKLEATIDEWLGHGETPVEALMPVVMYVGGRDFVVVVRHPEHDAALHDLSDRRRHAAHGEAATPVVVHAYNTNHWHTAHGDFAGWIEDEARSWIIYLDQDWRPSVAWFERDATGAVVGEAHDLTSNPRTMLLDKLGATQLIAWFDQHPDLIGEGDAVDNAVRLLTATYDARSLSPLDADRLASTARVAPAWFRYLWTRLDAGQIIDLDLLLELDAPRWVADWLEQPTIGEGLTQLDTRVEALRRIYDLTQGCAPDGTSRSDWALETLGEVRGLAHSQIVTAD